MSPKKSPIKKPAARAKWTVAVFMVGGDELGPSIQRDIVELRRTGSSDEVNVVAAVYPDPERTTPGEWLELQPVIDPDIDGEETEAAEVTIVGRPTIQGALDVKLDAFLQHVATAYPSDHYLLVLWGHASGLGFGDLRSGSKTAQLGLQALRNVLAQFQKSRPDNTKLEILGFCACAVNKAEYALELRDQVQYLIASQVGISMMMTWPFDRIVALVLMSPTVEPGSLARQIVQSFEEFYEPPPVALTALDLNHSEQLGVQVGSVSRAILTALSAPGDVGTLNNLCVLRTFMEALDAHPYESDPVIDFFDFCRKLVQERELDDHVRTEARNVLDQGYRTFVVQDARSGPKLGSLNGLSILAPDFDDPEWLKTCHACASSGQSYIFRMTKWATVTEKVYEFDQARKNGNGTKKTSAKK